ncbi:unnamed protein product, partial [marine sediment metagenome]
MTWNRNENLGRKKKNGRILKRNMFRIENWKDLVLLGFLNLEFDLA